MELYWPYLLFSGVSGGVLAASTYGCLVLISRYSQGRTRLPEPKASDLEQT